MYLYLKKTMGKVGREKKPARKRDKTNKRPCRFNQNVYWPKAKRRSLYTSEVQINMTAKFCRAMHNTS